VRPPRFEGKKGIVTENLRLARLYMLLLAIVALGRWLQGTAFHVPYEKGTHIFSIVTLTLFAAIFYGAFCRRWRRYRLMQAATLGVTFAVISQIVIILSTVASYALGLETYFNHPTALTGQPAASVGPLSFGQALTFRAGGFVANVILNAIAGMLGWVMGALLPDE
jgi:hypothetical protein